MKKNNLLVCSALISTICTYPIAVYSACTGSTETVTKELIDMDLESLINVQIVTSASKKEQNIKDTSAAIFVITQDDIRHSGMNNIPDLLRMVPGLQVARYNAHSWAVTSRGFGGYYANKLLVLMDGRTLYTPEFSGVYWDAVDTVLEDIERIEVVRGPGGTLWGANAVNGVINIITKSACDTEGGLLVAGGGDVEKGFARLRYGTALGDNTHVRFYAKTANHASSPDGFNDYNKDKWNFHQAGLRADGKLSSDKQWTLQGDVYTSAQQERNYRNSEIVDDVDVHGGNLLGRWQHKISSDSEFSAQAFYDAYKRGLLHQKLSNETVDLEVQYRFRFIKNHDVVIGANYRKQQSEIPDVTISHYNPSVRKTSLYSVFVQDDIQLSPKYFTLTLGGKLEHNDYTGWESQPNIRFSWTPTSQYSVWGAISRAVRTSSRDNHDSNTVIPAVLTPKQNPFYPNPILFAFTGNPEVQSETVTAYELGLRTQLSPHLSSDLAVFYNKYDKLMLLNSSVYVSNNQLILEEKINNGMDGKSSGAELSIDWKALENWRLFAAYTYFDLKLSVKPGVTTDGKRIEDLSPRHQFSLRSQLKLPHGFDLDLWLRHVASLNMPVGKYGDGGYVPAYNALDARLAWQFNKKLELSIVGQNLLKKQMYEFPVDRDNPLLTQTQRSIFAQVRYQF